MWGTINTNLGVDQGFILKPTKQLTPEKLLECYFVDKKCTIHKGKTYIYLKKINPKVFNTTGHH